VNTNIITYSLFYLFINLIVIKQQENKSYLFENILTHLYTQTLSEKKLKKLIIFRRRIYLNNENKNKNMKKKKYKNRDKKNKDHNFNQKKKSKKLLKA